MNGNLKHKAGWALAALIVSFSSQALADVSPEDRAAARSIFDEARKLAKAGQYAAACPKFEESQRLDAGIGTMFNLADCYQNVGRTASAWSAFLEAASLARAASQPDREGAARERAAALEPKLSRLSVTVATQAEVAGLEVKRDGRRVGKATYGEGVPVDPGMHTIEASAPGKKTWTSRVQVSAEATTVAVAVPELDTETAPPAVATSSHSSDAKGDNPPRHVWSGQRTAAVIVGGAGLLSLGVAGIFALKTKSSLSDAKAWCNGTDCWDQRGGELHHDAVKSADLATVFSAIGIVGLAGGAVLFLTAPSGKSPDAASQGHAPELTAGPRGIGLRGVF